MNSILNRFYSLLFGSLKITSDKLQSVHRICDNEFIEKFDEIVIIGDIHGCFDEFQLLLDKINQNDKNDPTKILKICTGDLVNKGPKSKEVIEYLMNNQDHCISVRGNHDEKMESQYIKYIETGEISPRNFWLKELSECHLKYLKQLPYSIRIPKLNVIIVHAGLVPNVPLEDQKLSDLLEMRDLVKEKNGLLTVTKSSGIAWASMWTGPGHVYFGHDAKRNLQEYPHATGLDTGLVYGRELTAKFIMGPRKGQYLSVKALKMWEIPKLQNIE